MGTIEVVDFAPFEARVEEVAERSNGAVVLWFMGRRGRFGVYCPPGRANGVNVGDRVNVSYDVGKYGLTAEAVAVAKS